MREGSESDFNALFFKPGNEINFVATNSFFARQTHSVNGGAIETSEISVKGVDGFGGICKFGIANESGRMQINFCAGAFPKGTAASSRPFAARAYFPRS